jgi:hypothetical protein
MSIKYIRLRVQVREEEAAYAMLVQLPDDDSRRNLVKSALNLMAAKILTDDGTQRVSSTHDPVESQTQKKSKTPTKATTRPTEIPSVVKKIPALAGIGDRGEENWGF